MSISLYFLLFIFFLFILITTMVAKSSNKQDFFNDTNLDEWLCPNCGFEVQVGDSCIYCGELKDSKK